MSNGLFLNSLRVFIFLSGTKYTLSVCISYQKIITSTNITYFTDGLIIYKTGYTSIVENPPMNLSLLANLVNNYAVSFIDEFPAHMIATSDYYTLGFETPTLIYTSNCACFFNNCFLLWKHSLCTFLFFNKTVYSITLITEEINNGTFSTIRVVANYTEIYVPITSRSTTTATSTTTTSAFANTWNWRR